MPCTCKDLDMHGFVTSYKLLNLHENAYTCITIYCVPGKTKCSGRCENYWSNVDTIQIILNVDILQKMVQCEDTKKCSK